MDLSGSACYYHQHLPKKHSLPLTFKGSRLPDGEVELVPEAEWLCTGPPAPQLGKSPQTRLVKHTGGIGLIFVPSTLLIFCILMEENVPQVFSVKI